MSNRFSAPTAEELAARGLNPDGSPIQKEAPKPAPKPAAKPAAKKEG